MARIVTLMMVAALAGTPAVAGAASNPLLPQPAPQQQQQAPAQQPQQAPARPQQQVGDGTLGLGKVLAIILAACVLIGGIWSVILRDAKRATAGTRRTADAETGAGRGGSATRAARRSRKPSAEERKRRKRGRAAK